MTEILKTSGFLGLLVMMVVGLYQNYLHAIEAPVPGWLVGGHAHLGVLSILAIVLGFAVPALGVTGRLRSVVTGAFVAGQWGLPLSVWLGAGLGIGILYPTSFLWGLLLVVSMAIMAWYAAIDPADTDGSRDGGEAAGAPTDD